jgi:hypothetical protein
MCTGVTTESDHVHWCDSAEWSLSRTMCTATTYSLVTLRDQILKISFYQIHFWFFFEKSKYEKISTPSFFPSIGVWLWVRVRLRPSCPTHSSLRCLASSSSPSSALGLLPPSSVSHTAALQAAQAPWRRSSPFPWLLKREAQMVHHRRVVKSHTYTCCRGANREHHLLCILFKLYKSIFPNLRCCQACQVRRGGRRPWMGLLLRQSWP